MHAARFARTKLLLLTLALLLATPARAQTHDLSLGLGSSGFDHVSALVRDASQRLIVAGRYTDAIDLGGGVFVPADGSDNFLAAYDAQGNHLWSRNIVGTALLRMNALAVDASGDIVLVGDGSGSFNLGGADLTGSSFAARYDSDGNHLWSRTLAVTSGGDAEDVLIDADGNIVITGEGLLSDSSVAKLDPDGNALWQNGVDAVGNGVAVDLMGNIHAAGVFYPSITFGDSIIATVGLLDGFMVSYEPDGTLRSFLTFTDNAWSGAVDVAVDSESNVWMAGFFNGILDLGTGAIEATKGFQSFVSVFDPLGNVLCTQTYPGSGVTSAAGTATGSLDAGAGVVHAGPFNGSVDTGAGILNAAGGDDIFVVGFDGPCSPAWSLGIGGSGHESVEAVDVGQGVALAGSFEQSVDFGGGPIVSNGDKDGFFARYLTPATAVPPSSLADRGWLRAVPNPWNPSTTVSFELPRDGPVTLEVFDSRGRRVRTLLRGEGMESGEHAVLLDGGGLASGVYRLRLRHAMGELREAVVLLK